MLQYVAGCCTTVQLVSFAPLLHCVAVSCSVLQCVLQCVAVCCSVLHCVAASAYNRESALGLGLTQRALVSKV